MKIILDIRENALFDKMILLNPSIEKQQLSLGDALLQTDDGNTIIMVERKSISDLLASIKDGRYEEQSHRLMHSTTIPRHNIFYLLEGNIQFLTPNEKKIIFSAMTSLSIFKGFSVVRTMNLQETADILISMSEKIGREMEKGKTPFSIESREQTNVEIKPYCEVVKTVKKDNITSENIGELLLCQIPGISSISAQVIIKKFDGSFSKMCQEIATNPSPIDLFKDIVLEKDGKTRKISKTCGENIVRYLK
jgi:ERCC4-type nuclease